ncbi:uncharacterized protein LOC143897261 [Temnothorax americanus]|uniref:uncharacterized protein LOC143897261 n=1 Tax=Temnothorax americanus TaxID=1964332 RepID=UPI004067E787
MINSSYAYKECDVSCIGHPSVEMLAIAVPFQEQELFICNLYRHTGQDTPAAFFNNLFTFAQQFKYALFVGDFNAHHPDWFDTRKDIIGEYIADAVIEQNLVLLNDGTSTFCNIVGNIYSIIDLTIASPNLATICTYDYERDEDLRGSDHLPIIIRINSPLTPRQCFSHRLKLNKDSLDVLHSALSKEEIRVKEINVDDATKAYNQLTGIIKKNVAVALRRKNLTPSKFTIKCKRFPAPWWNEVCENAVNDRRAAAKLFKSNYILDNLLNYKRSIAVARRTLRREKLQGWKNLCAKFNAKTPIQQVWRFVKSFKNQKQATHSGVNAEEEARLIQAAISKFCPSSCSDEDLALNDMRKEDAESLEDVAAWMDEPISMEEIYEALKSFKKHSSPGPDQLDYVIL